MQSSALSSLKAINELVGNIFPPLPPYVRERLSISNHLFPQSLPSILLSHLVHKMASSEQMAAPTEVWGSTSTQTGRRGSTAGPRASGDGEQGGSTVAAEENENDRLYASGPSSPRCRGTGRVAGSSALLIQVSVELLHHVCRPVLHSGPEPTILSGSCSP